jgi:hypothetical protein
LPTVKVFVGGSREPFDLSRKAVCLAMPTTEIVLNGLREGDTHNALLSILSRAYILAEDLKSTKLKGYIIDTIYASIRDEGYGPTSDANRLIYETTSPDSGLRRTVIAFFVWQATESWWVIDRRINDKDDWAFQDIPERFKTEVGNATFERVHLMDDGNPFNDDHEAEETGFGPDYFYGDDQAKLRSSKWLRNDPGGVRAEEEWDAARFQAEKETADDRAITNDDEDAMRMEEMEAENAENSTGLGEDTDITRDEDLGDSKEANKSDERAVRAEDWLKLDLPYWRDALLLQQTLTNGPKRMINLIFDKGGSERSLFRYTFGEWAEMLGMSKLDVYSAARKLMEPGIVSLEFE